MKPHSQSHTWVQDQDKCSMQKGTQHTQWRRKREEETGSGTTHTVLSQLTSILPSLVAIDSVLLVIKVLVCPVKLFRKCPSQNKYMYQATHPTNYMYTSSQIASWQVQGLVTDNVINSLTIVGYYWRFLAMDTSHAPYFHFCLELAQES